MTERRDFTAGLVVGAMFGVALGLLFAPQPGTETRERLRREGERLRERARVKADDVAGQARRAAGDVADRMRTSDFVNRAMDAAGDAIARGRSAFEARSDRVRRAYEEGRSAPDTTLEEPTHFGEPEN
ncbi:MAG TPA: YtxH domain-containing protein [bacterium]|nr:YtxH domain-containing protein [bacterium]